jgi:type II secretory pathway predicted ATPase ExeA
MYETFYGLTGKPFQLNPDPAFYFGSRQHRRAMAYLEYGLHQNEGFIVVTGDVGAGAATGARSLAWPRSERTTTAEMAVITATAAAARNHGRRLRADRAGPWPSSAANGTCSFGTCAPSAPTGRSSAVADHTLRNQTVSPGS